MPTLGINAKTVAPAQPLADKETAKSFSAVLEQAGLSPQVSPPTQPTTSDERETKSLGKEPAKRETTPSDSKTGDSQSRADASSQTLPPAAVIPDKTVPIIVVQPVLLPFFTWNAGTEDCARNAAKGDSQNDAATSSATSETNATGKPDAIGEWFLTRVVSEHVTLSEMQRVSAPPNDEASRSTPSETTSTGKPDPIRESFLMPVVSEHAAPLEAQRIPAPQEPSNLAQAVPLTSDIPGPASVVTSNLDPLNNTGLSRPHGLSSDAAQASKHDNLVPPTTTLATDQNVAACIISPPPVAAPAPTPVNIKAGPAQVKSVKPASEKSRASVLPESVGNTQENADASTSAKVQSHKGGSSASETVQAPDSNTSSNQLRTSEASPSFSMAGAVAGTQPTTTGDGKAGTAALTPEGNEQQSGRLSPEQTGVTQDHLPESSAAYTPLVNSAKLVERMGESELRVGIRAGEFGSVDIRTSMVRNQFTAEISVERSELGRAMAAELPSLHDRLAEQRVSVANIAVQNSASGHSSASQHEKPRSEQPTRAMNTGTIRDDAPAPAWLGLETTGPELRLDIHM